MSIWKKLVKRAAGIAFTWGLKKLTELAPPEPEPVKRKPRTRKPSAH